MKAAFLAPVYYKGTSFERICTAIEYAINTREMPIDSIILHSATNNLPPDKFDDEVYYKSQLELINFIINNIDNYDRLLFLDFFNPGIDIVRYYTEQFNKKIKLAALVHGGTFYEGDLQSSEWISGFEQAWSGLYDRLYVPSQYAYNLLPSTMSKAARVTPWALDGVALDVSTPTNQHKYDVVFPHRLSSDKGINDLLHIASQLPHVTFVITSPSGIISEEFKASIKEMNNIQVLNCLENKDCFKVFAQSRIVLSCAKQELYGYSVAEAVLSGCYPVLPNDQCYPEYYPKDALYNSLADAVKMIKGLLKETEPCADSPRSIIEKHSFSTLLDDFLRL